MKKILAIFSAIILTLTLAGCSTKSKQQEDKYYSANSKQWTDCPLSDQPKRECKNIEVKLSSTDKSKVQLAVAKTPARNQNNKKGTLVLMPSGPNTSGLSFAAGMESFLPKDVLNNYDIIAYDRRGVGRSETITCDDVPDSVSQITEFATPEQIQDYKTIANDLGTYVNKCNSKSNQLFSNSGAKTDADDVDAIRQAVGTEKVSLLAYSYGTLTAQAYLNKYPTHVDKSVLDSTFDPNISGAKFAYTNDPTLGFPMSFNDKLTGPKLSQEQSNAAQALQESADGQSINQAYICSDYKWNDDISKVGKELEKQDSKQPGLAMDPLSGYGVCSKFADKEKQSALGAIKTGSGVTTKPLLVNSTEDTHAPLAGAKAVAGRMNANLYQVSGNRHIVTGFGRSCASDTVSKYLMTGALAVNSKCTS
ncbi:MAG: alpha/beta hydrolase [Micrococcaceae bacterium]